MTETAPVDDISINVLMLGGTGCGKSATIAAMHQASKYTSSFAPFELKMTGEWTGIALDNAAVFRRKCQSGDDPVEIPRTANPGGTILRYPLSVFFEDELRLILNFIDTSGEDFYNIDNNTATKLHEQIMLSPVTLLVVDALALFRGKDLEEFRIDEHKQRNSPERAIIALEHWLASSHFRKGLLCIIPVKIEDLIYSEDGAFAQYKYSEIYSRIRSYFRPVTNVVDRINNADPSHTRLKKNIDVVITPIQTCACLRHHSYRQQSMEGNIIDPGEFPIEWWTRIKQSTNTPPVREYQPTDCHIPLGFILAFLLGYARDNESIDNLRQRRFGSHERTRFSELETIFPGEWIAWLEDKWERTRVSAERQYLRLERTLTERQLSDAILTLYRRSQLDEKYYLISTKSGYLP